MARSKVVQFDYFDFLKIYRTASDKGNRIEPKDKARWESYVSEHGLNEVAATAIARQQLPTASAVIIDEGAPTDGLYFFTNEEEACLRLVAVDD